MKARFVGKDNSLGFKFGKVYEISTGVKEVYKTGVGNIIAIALSAIDTSTSENKLLVSYYSSIESFLENWELIDAATPAPSKTEQVPGAENVSEKTYSATVHIKTSGDAIPKICEALLNIGKVSYLTVVELDGDCE